MTQIRVLCGDRSVIASVKQRDIPRHHHVRWPGGITDGDCIVVTALSERADKYLRRVQVTRKRADGTKETVWEYQPDKNRILRLLDIAE